MSNHSTYSSDYQRPTIHVDDRLILDGGCGYDFDVDIVLLRRYTKRDDTAVYPEAVYAPAFYDTMRCPVRCVGRPIWTRGPTAERMRRRRRIQYVFVFVSLGYGLRYDTIRYDTMLRAVCRSSV